MADPPDQQLRRNVALLRSDKRWPDPPKGSSVDQLHLFATEDPLFWMIKPGRQLLKPAGISRVRKRSTQIAANHVRLAPKQVDSPDNFLHRVQTTLPVRHRIFFDKAVHINRHVDIRDSNRLHKIHELLTPSGTRHRLKP